VNASGLARSVLKGVSAGLVLLVLAVLYFWPVLTGRRFLGSDFLAQTYPWRRYATQELFAGRLPHWSPHVGFGFPFLADIETTVLYPPSLVGSVLAGPAISYLALEWEMIAHHLIAGLGMVLLGLRTGLGWPGALVGGVSFAFSGFLWAHAGHATVVQSASWAPWVLLGGAALIARPGARAAAATAVALALSILGGHPQVAGYAGLALGTLLCVAGWSAPGGGSAAERRRRRWALARAAVLALALAAGLAAVQLLPTAVLARHSIRWGRDAAFLQMGKLPVEYLLTYLLPFAFEGTPRWRWLDEFHGYTGILSLTLAAWALARRRDRWTAVFGCLAALGLLIALGVPPASWVAAAGAFRIPARAVLLFDLGVAGLAARGADALWRPAGVAAGAPRLVRALVATALLAGALGAWLTRSGVPAALAPSVAEQLARFAGWLAAATVVIVAARRLHRPTWAAPALVLTVLGIEILSFQREIGWSPRPPELRWPAVGRIDALARGGPPYRVGGDLYGFGRTSEHNAGLVYRVPTGSIYSSLSLRRVGAVLTLLDRPTSLDPYRLAAIRWVTAGAPSLVFPGTGAPPGLERAGPDLWAVPDPLPRAHLPADVRVVEGRREQVRALATVDPRQTVLVDRPAARCPGRVRGPERGRADFLADEPARVLLRVRAVEAGPLVLSDTHYPGWGATVDGAPATIHRANHAFRMVCVPAGEHLVEFTFRQPGFHVGLALTGLSAVLVVALVAVPHPLPLRGGAGRRRAAPEARTSP
jgi:hypothetical protein